MKLHSVFVEVSLNCPSKTTFLHSSLPREPFFFFKGVVMCSISGDKSRKPCFPLPGTCFLILLHHWTHLWPGSHKGKSARVFLGMVFLPDQKSEPLYKVLLFHSSSLLLEMFCEDMTPGTNLRP